MPGFESRGAGILTRVGTFQQVENLLHIEARLRLST